MGTERLYRSRTDRMIAGVAGGLGQYFGIDPTIVRLFFVLAAIFSGGLAVLAYLALWVLIPEAPYSFGPTPWGSSGSSYGSSGASTGSSAPVGATGTETSGETPTESSGSDASSGSSDPFAETGTRGAGGFSNPTGSFGSSGGSDPFGSGSGFGGNDPYGPGGKFGGSDPFGPPPYGAPRRQRNVGVGYALVVLGALILASNLHLLSWLSLGVIWPVFLIGIGVLLLYRHNYFH